MPDNWIPKQTTFATNYVSLVQAFLNIVDEFIAKNGEFSADGYGTGGQNAITDAVCQSVLPAMDAAAFNEAEGAMVSILATVASNRGYLEICRP